MTQDWRQPLDELLETAVDVDLGREPAGRPLRKIADEIMRKWANPYFGAVPYINAMFALDKITDKYNREEGTDIVIYFLSNAKNWRGEDARRIKADLKAMLVKAARR
jgi:hypothetical protein